MDISVFVSDLLYDHDCVMVPGFGGFICNYRPAEIHPVLHYVNPPSKSLSFNIHLNSNDGLLVNYIAKKGNLSYDTALGLVTNWVDTSKSLLRSNETVMLKQIGRIFSDIEGNVQFTPDDSVNYLKASFALKPITAQPVLRGKEVDFTEKFTQETKKRLPQTGVWKIAAAIILIVGIGTLIQLMRMGVEIKPLGLNEANVFSFITHIADNHETVLAPVPVETEKPVTPVEPKKETPTAISQKNEPSAVVHIITETPKTNQHGYYIIVGAFSENKNAETVKLQLAQKFPESSLFFEKSGGLTRVGYLAGTDAQTADEQLRVAQAENAQYWLLKK